MRSCYGSLPLSVKGVLASEQASEQLSLWRGELSQLVMWELQEVHPTVHLSVASSEHITVALELSMRSQMRLPSRLLTELPLEALSYSVLTLLVENAQSLLLMPALRESLMNKSTEIQQALHSFVPSGSR